VAKGGPGVTSEVFSDLNGTAEIFVSIDPSSTIRRAGGPYQAIPSPRGGAVGMSAHATLAATLRYHAPRRRGIQPAARTARRS